MEQYTKYAQSLQYCFIIMTNKKGEKEMSIASIRSVIVFHLLSIFWIAFFFRGRYCFKGYWYKARTKYRIPTKNEIELRWWEERWDMFEFVKHLVLHTESGLGSQFTELKVWTLVINTKMQARIRKTKTQKIRIHESLFSFFFFLVWIRILIIISSHTPGSLAKINLSI